MRPLFVLVAWFFLLVLCWPVALLVLEEVLSGVTEYWQIIIGPIFLLVVLFARGGIDGMLLGARRG